MSDLVTNLLTQYYGLGVESSGKKFLSIHQSVENAKKEEEKQVTEENSLSTNEENPSEGESKVINNYLSLKSYLFKEQWDVAQ